MVSRRGKLANGVESHYTSLSIQSVHRQTVIKLTPIFVLTYFKLGSSSTNPVDEAVRFALRHVLIKTERTLEDRRTDVSCRYAVKSAHLLTITLDDGSDNRTAISIRADHFLDVGTAFDNLMRRARETDFPHGRKLFAFEPVLDGSRY